MEITMQIKRHKTKEVTTEKGHSLFVTQMCKYCVTVKLIPGATAKGMKHHVRGSLEDNFLKTILHFRISEMKPKKILQTI